jgi:diaminopimelate epimerase
MGNPHAVIRHDDPDAVVSRIGPLVETAARFPERTNVEFIRRDGPSEITMRVWERGAGVTMACGTGACAAAVAAVRLDGLMSPVTVHLAGGDLLIAVTHDLDVTMTGPADPIYAGHMSPHLTSRLESM